MSRQEWREDIHIYLARAAAALEISRWGAAEHKKSSPTLLLASLLPEPAGRRSAPLQNAQGLEEPNSETILLHAKGWGWGGEIHARDVYTRQKPLHVPYKKSGVASE